jgi:hypothetical protein
MVENKDLDRNAPKEAGIRVEASREVNANPFLQNFHHDSSMEQHLGGDMSAPVIDVRLKLCYGFPCMYDSHAVKQIFVVGNGRYHDTLINVGTTNQRTQGTPL